MGKDEAPHTFICCWITFDLLDSERCGSWCRLTGWIIWIAWNFQHCPNRHRIWRNVWIHSDQFINRYAELERDAAEGLALSHGVGKRCGCGQRCLKWNQALGSQLRRVLGGGQVWDEVYRLGRGYGLLRGASSQNKKDDG